MTTPDTTPKPVRPDWLMPVIVTVVTGLIAIGLVAFERPLLDVRCHCRGGSDQHFDDDQGLAGACQEQRLTPGPAWP